MFGASLSYCFHQGTGERHSTYQTRAWETPLGTGLGAWTFNETDTHALRAQAESLRENVYNLRHEREWIVGCVRNLNRGKERLRGEVQSLRRRLGGLRRVACNLRREKNGLGGEVRRLTILKNNIKALVQDERAELLELERQWDLSGGRVRRPYSPTSSISSSELDAPKATPLAWDQADASDAQIYALKRDTRDLEAINRELADKYSESLRCLENAQANFCYSCSTRNTTASLVGPTVESSESPKSKVTQSCCLPESPPPNPDRNRRQIAQNDPSGDDGYPSGVTEELEVGGDDLHHNPTAKRCELAGPVATTVAGGSGLDDFLLADSPFDFDESDPVLV